MVSTREAVPSSSFAAMKKLLFLGLCLVALASQPVRAQASGSDIVTVRISAGVGRIYIATSTGLGKTEATEIDVPSYTPKNNAPIADIYQQTIAKLSQQGYTLKGMSGGDSVTTLVFTKEK